MRPARKIIIFASVTLAALSSVAWLVTVATSREKPLRSNAITDPLTDLERRISKIEKVGPFIVTDKQGREIFTVETRSDDDAAGVFNSKGVRVASIGADQNGGYFDAASANKFRSTNLRFFGILSGLFFTDQIKETVTENGKTSREVRDVVRLELGRGEGGNYSLRVNSTADQIAGIGESKAGSGAIIVGDTQVSKRAAITVGDDNKGIIGIFTGAGNAVAAFGEAVGNNGGSLVLGDTKSEPRVKMGTNNFRYGVVLTLPQGLPYVPRSGLPGSYLLGCAGGPSCVP